MFKLDKDKSNAEHLMMLLDTQSLPEEVLTLITPLRFNRLVYISSRTRREPLALSNKLGHLVIGATDKGVVRFKVVKPVSDEDDIDFTDVKQGISLEGLVSLVTVYNIVGTTRSQLRLVDPI